MNATRFAQYLLIAVLFISSSWAVAQPWQWQRYEGDYYNPTGFPQPSSCSYGTEAMGDFNGDRRDDFLCMTQSSFIIAERDSIGFHWTVMQGQQELEYAYTTWAADLDTDSVDELILYGFPVSCWKAVSFNPWIWERRDDLLSGLFFPENLAKAVFGDYDSDGLLNGIYWIGEIWWGEIHLYERDSSGEWTLDSVLVTSDDLYVIGGLYDGDFDHDGDVDFAVAPYFTDVPTYAAFGENTPEGLVLHIGSDLGWEYYDLPGPTGGDLDGDGQWEGLYLYWHWGYAGYHLADVEACSSQFLCAASKQYLGQIPGPLIGNFRTPSGTVVGATRSWAYGPPFYVMDAFALMSHSENGWNDLHNGFYDPMGYQCKGGNMADLDGDGLKDIFTILEDYYCPWGSHWKWALWKNFGNASTDQYSHSPGGRFSFPSLAGADTTFHSPQIGDISGDGRAEFAAIVQPTGGERQVLFYEMIGPIADTTFELRSEWSRGLPVGLEKIRLGDIDNDGRTELIGLAGGVWHAYFYRHGQWDLYSNILPDFTANDISFADLDNDGDLDLFTPTEVWVSLSPSVADEPFTLSPSSSRLLAYPNPFNPSTQIAYDLPKAGHVSVKVFDLLGREVAALVDGVQPAGVHSVGFDGSSLASGIYFCRLRAESFAATKKMMLLK